MAELAAIAEDHGLGLVPAARGEDAVLIHPAVVHWEANHYAAIRRWNGEQFLVEDPTFRTKVWMDPDAILEESSGYFLIPRNIPLPAGWRYVEAEEAAQVFGKGYPETHDDETGGECNSLCCDEGPGGSPKPPATRTKSATSPPGLTTPPSA